VVLRTYKKLWPGLRGCLDYELMGKGDECSKRLNCVVIVNIVYIVIVHVN